MRYIALGRSYWRPYEKESCDKYFEQAYHVSTSDVLFWRHNTENVTQEELQKCLEIEQDYTGIVINPMSSFKYTRDKLSCFEKWSEYNIPVPKSFGFNSKDDFYAKHDFDGPFLLRLNDRATGECTYLVDNIDNVNDPLNKLLSDYSKYKNYTTRMMCVQFIDTKVANNNISFRIHVAGNSVVSGYARLSDDWLAISAKFTSNIKDEFVEQNKRVKELIDNNHDDIVNSVKCLNLHHQGVDVIADKHNNLYFLEVQPFYFSGRPPGAPNPTSPPFWNPYKPKELVEWLTKEKDYLSKEMPYYYTNWLDKETHFNNCYKELFNYVRT